MPVSVTPLLTTIAKILGLSALISLSIKYVGPGLLVPATDRVALLMVLLPSIGVACLLWLQRPQGNLNSIEKSE
jgi:hypothetical protein